MSELFRVNRLSAKKFIQYCFFVFFIFDIFFMGSGMNYAIAGLGTRKVIFAVFCLISMFVYFDGRDQLTFFTAIQAAAFLAFVFIWIFFLPLLRNGSLSYSIADALPLVAVAIFIFTKDFASRHRFWFAVRRVMTYSVISFSLLHVLLYGAYWFRPDLIDAIAGVLKLFWEPKASDEMYFVFLSLLDNGLLRVYFGSSFLLLLGLYFALIKFDSPINTAMGRFLVFVLVVLALWTTNTRSLLLGAFIFVGFFPVFNKLFRMIPVHAVSIFCLIIAPFFLSFILIPTVDPKMLSIVGFNREGSDELRVSQLFPLFNEILENPFFGQGFGGSAQLIRAEDAPYAYELSILALFMKLGMFGFVFVSLILSSTVNSSILTESKIFPKEMALLYSLYFAYILSCFYNPYMFGFFGTFFSLFLLYEFTFLMRFRRDD